MSLQSLTVTVPTPFSSMDPGNRVIAGAAGRGGPEHLGGGRG